MEVTHQSGVSRLFNSVLAAVCLAPLLLLVTTFILGFNEKRDVCDSRAIEAGSKQLMKVECTDPMAGNGKLVFFNCDLTSAQVDLSSLQEGNPPPLGEFSSKLPSMLEDATGLDIMASMKQCVETSSSSTKKDKGGGGGKTTTTIYEYKTEWRGNSVGNSFAHKSDPIAKWDANCGVDNPDWPTDLPTSQTKYASTAKVGSFDISGSYLTAIPLSAPALQPADAPSGWQTSGCEGGAHFCKSSGKPHGIGDIRISFKKTNWDAPMMSVLGENHAGTVSQWVAPDSWMCSGTKIGQLKTGTITKEDFMKQMAATAGAVTWVLRIVGFCLAWFAFSLMMKPLGVAADCIPCVGPCLGDMVEAIACVISVCPACACTMMVAGFVWIFMRPLMGLLMLAIGIGICVGFAAYKMRTKRARALSGGLMA